MGVYDYVKRISPESELIGFLMGPHGLFTGTYEVISAEKMARYRNQGVRATPRVWWRTAPNPLSQGFDMIGSGRHKIHSPEQFAGSKAVCVVVGGASRCSC